MWTFMCLKLLQYGESGSKEMLEQKDRTKLALYVATNRDILIYILVKWMLQKVQKINKIIRMWFKEPIHTTLTHKGMPLIFDSFYLGTLQECVLHRFYSIYCYVFSLLCYYGKYCFYLKMTSEYNLHMWQLPISKVCFISCYLKTDVVFSW